MEHERWLEERRALGWTLGPRDPAEAHQPEPQALGELDEEPRRMSA